MSVSGNTPVRKHMTLSAQKCSIALSDTEVVCVKLKAIYKLHDHWFVTVLIFPCYHDTERYLICYCAFFRLLQIRPYGLFQFRINSEIISLFRHLVQLLARVEDKRDGRPIAYDNWEDTQRRNAPRNVHASSAIQIQEHRIQALSAREDNVHTTDSMIMATGIC
jgi:hypothetical protein